MANPVSNELVNLKQELCLAIDNYNKPKTLHGMDAKTSRFLKLLYMKQGTNPSSPYMGIDISSYKFDFMDNELIINLKTKIEEQVSQYLPELLISNIIISPYKGYLIVAIEEYDNVTKRSRNIGLLLDQEPSLAQVFSK